MTAYLGNLVQQQQRRSLPQQHSQLFHRCVRFSLSDNCSAIVMCMDEQLSRLRCGIRTLYILYAGWVRAIPGHIHYIPRMGDGVARDAMLRHVTVSLYTNF